ncbi:MAG: phosphatase PAP2 family protein [Deltaproteobacteria bacterium]|nr:phosphatase PAP2 family protein [Deltaproteobacteria bacterium]
MSISAIFLTILWLLLPGTVKGKEAVEPAEQDSEKERVALLDNFSLPFLITDGALVLYSSTEYIWEYNQGIFDEPLIEPMGTGSLDRWFSDLAYDPNAGLLHHGVPEALPYVMAFGAGGYFALEAVSTWIQRESLIEGNINGDHKLLAFIEAYIWTQSLAITCQRVIGRRRPHVDKGLSDAFDQGWGTEYSFYSGHTSTAFMAATFISRHLGEVLDRTWLKDSSSTQRFWLGRVLPYSFFYGLATYAGYSRVYEQQHYMSDVVTAALVSTLVSNLVYSLHFSGDQPSIRGKQVLLAPLSLPSGAGLSLIYRF